MTRTKTYTSFCHPIKMDKKHDLLIVDPFVISIADLEIAGVENIVEVKRSMWGRGVSITVVEENIFSKLIVI